MNESTRWSIPSPPLPAGESRGDGGDTSLPQAEYLVPGALESASTMADVEKHNSNVASTIQALLARLRATRAEAAVCNAITRAEWWAQWLGAIFSLQRIALATPHITASAEDEVVFEWWVGRRKLTVYVTAATVEFVRVWGRDIFNEMSDGRLEDGAQALSLWLWLTAEAQ